jgi:hypothetical protein
MTFTKEGATAIAQLHWDEAPQTCEAICDRLPIEGPAHQAIYSGSESVVLLEEVLRLPKENARSEVRRGEVAFVWLEAGSSYGVNEDFAEICWFYDIDSRPSMWEGPVEVNVFAQIVEPADRFYRVCRRIRREGVKPVAITARRKGNHE